MKNTGIFMGYSNQKQTSDSYLHHFNYRTDKEMKETKFCSGAKKIVDQGYEFMKINLCCHCQLKLLCCIGHGSSLL